MKKTTKVIAVLVMALSLLTNKVVVHATVYTGSCGESVIWELDVNSGVLTISGEGKMSYYIDESSKSPWYKLKEDIKTVVIEDGVSSIESYAFDSCLALNSIFIPASVKSLGYDVFKQCNSLSYIIVDSKNPVYDSRMSCNAIVESSSDILVYGCQNTVIPNNVISIGDSAFAYCTSLTEITIPDSVRSIEDYAFDHCDNLTDITIPNSVTTIGNSAFAYCTSLQQVQLPEQLQEISEKLFSNCESLNSINIPDSIINIGNWAFENCYSLTTMTIPASVTNIGYSIFSYCKSLTTISVDEQNPVFDSRDHSNGIIDSKSNTLVYGCKNTTIPSSVVEIGCDAFKNITSLSSITIPNSVTSIADRAFYNCQSLTRILLTSNITDIGDEAFYFCLELKGIYIPNSVNSIGKNAFAYCIALTDLTIPNSVNSIGENAFVYCVSLTDLTIPNSVNSIGKYAFANCISLTDITIPNSVKTIKENTFYNCASLESVTIPEGVVNIQKDAFEGAGSLSKVRIAKSVANIEGDIFSRGNKSLCIYGVSNSYAEMYSRRYNYPFVVEFTSKSYLLPSRTRNTQGKTFDSYFILSEIFNPPINQMKMTNV